MYIIIDNWNVLMEGTWFTVKLFLATIVLSLPLGFPIALGSNGKFWFLKILCDFYVLIFRGTPLILQLFFFYFFLPLTFDIQLDIFNTSVLTFVLNYAAYFAEIYRGGINSIDKGQFEAAQALGLSKRQTMLDIILPQTMKSILPPVFNETIVLVKDTALASTIGMPDIMKVTTGIVSSTSNTAIFVGAAGIYLILNLVLTLVQKKLENHFSRYDALEEH